MKWALVSALDIRLDTLLAAKRTDEAKAIAARLKSELSLETNILNIALKQISLSRFEAANGNLVSAQRYLKKALQSSRLNRESYAHALLVLGEAALDAGKKTKARSYLEKARKEFSILVQNGYRENELARISELSKKT